MADLQTTRREERDFLLASLDDLEAEYLAGDLEEDDYAALKSDYTTRAARVIRALDRAEAAATPVERDWKRIGLWTLLIVVLSTAAGLLIAEFSANRSDGDVITGGARETTRQQLFEAQRLLGTDRAEALAIYDSILETSPANAEALAYRGWLTRLDGDSETAATFVDQALLVEPDYADALVFGAVIALDLDDVGAAAQRLATLDASDPPPFIAQLVQGQGLRIRIAEGLLLTGEPDSWVESGMTIEQLNHAAESVLATEPERGAELYNVVLSQVPDDVEILTFSGFYQALVALDAGPDAIAVMERGYEDLSIALDVDPEWADALVYRAFVGCYVDQEDQSRADLAAYDALDAEREDLETFIFQFGLREALASSPCVE
ncbi:MAG: hypothetical protein AAF548_08525 [Actinomycetota bacterium]